jgi:hypothetical protein
MALAANHAQGAKNHPTFLRNQMPKISIVIPVYKSEMTLPDLIGRIDSIMKAEGLDF